MTLNFPFEYVINRTISKTRHIMGCVKITTWRRESNGVFLLKENRGEKSSI